MAALELQLDGMTTPLEPDADELRSLETVEALLADCRSLLAESGDADAELPMAA